MSTTNYRIPDDVFEQTVKETTTNAEWVYECDKNNCKVFRKSVFPSQVNKAVKITATVDMKWRDLKAVVLNVDNRTKISDITEEAKLLEDQNAEQWDVLYTRLAAPSRFVSARDFVVGRRWAEFSELGIDGEGVLVAMKSVDHPKAPTANSNNAVRGEFIMQAILLKKVDDNKTDIVILNQVELNGMIPSFVQNYFMSTVPSEMPHDLLPKGVKYERERGRI